MNPNRMIRRSVAGLGVVAAVMAPTAAVADAAPAHPAVVTDSGRNCTDNEGANDPLEWYMCAIVKGPGHSLHVAYGNAGVIAADLPRCGRFVWTASAKGMRTRTFPSKHGCAYDTSPSSNRNPWFSTSTKINLTYPGIGFLDVKWVPDPGNNQRLKNGLRFLVWKEPAGY